MAEVSAPEVDDDEEDRQPHNAAEAAPQRSQQHPGRSIRAISLLRRFKQWHGPAKEVAKTTFQLGLRCRRERVDGLIYEVADARVLKLSACGLVIHNCLPAGKRGKDLVLACQ